MAGVVSLEDAPTATTLALLIAPKRVTAGVGAFPLVQNVAKKRAITRNESSGATSDAVRAWPPTFGERVAGDGTGYRKVSEGGKVYQVGFAKRSRAGGANRITHHILGT
jgi:hypothetical protein